MRAIRATARVASLARSTTATRSISVGEKVEINILNDGEDPVVMADAEYPDFIWSLGVC